MVDLFLLHWYPGHEDYVEWFQAAQRVFFCVQREISSRVLHDTLGLLLPMRHPRRLRWAMPNLSDSETQDVCKNKTFRSLAYNRDFFLHIDWIKGAFWPPQPDFDDIPSGANWL